EIGGPLVAVIAGLAEIPLAEIARNLVQQILFQIVVNVVAALALNEVLRGNHVTAVEAELQGVLALGPVQVFDHLVRILNAVLRRVRIRSQVQPEIVIECDVRESVQTGELLIPYRVELAETVEGDAEFVSHRRTESVVVRNRGQIEALRK